MNRHADRREHGRADFVETGIAEDAARVRVARSMNAVGAWLFAFGALCVMACGSFDEIEAPESTVDSIEPSTQSGVVSTVPSSGDTDETNGRVSTATSSGTRGTSSFHVGGSVENLIGSGLILEVNAGTDLERVIEVVPNEASFEFAPALPDQADYEVRVREQPSSPNQICEVENASGRIDGEPVRSVRVVCVTKRYSVGGSIEGLEGEGFEIRLTVRDSDVDMSLGLEAGEEDFVFGEPIDDGSEWELEVTSAPQSPRQVCEISPRSGTTAGADVSDVLISCEATGYRVGGSVNDLLGDGLRLSLHADQIVVALVVESRAESFEFPPSFESGVNYRVEIMDQPSNGAEECTISMETGTIGDDDVDSVQISCAFPSLGQECLTTGEIPCMLGERCRSMGETRCSPESPAGDEPNLTIPFVHVRSGAFMMGSASTELGRNTGNPDREVRESVSLTRNYFITRYHITNRQWRVLAGSDSAPGFNSSCEECPVAHVTWWSALWFANELSRRAGLPECYDFSDLPCASDVDDLGPTGALNCGNGSMPRVNALNGDVHECVGYRLPTSAEWEFAARAGTTTATFVGNLSGTIDDCDSQQAALNTIAYWCFNADVVISGGEHILVTMPTDGSDASDLDGNDLGLRQPLGNVYQWVWDRGFNTPMRGDDPITGDDAERPERRVARGGSVQSTPADVRSARIVDFLSTNRFQDLGFRLVRTSPVSLLE